MVLADEVLGRLNRIECVAFFFPERWNLLRVYIFGNLIQISLGFSKVANI